MKTAVYLLALGIICEAFIVPEEEIEKLQIEKPEGCEILSIPTDSRYFMTCHGFSMQMSAYAIIPVDSSSARQEVMSSTVECSHNPPPYEHLRLINSKRNSLILENCPPPEHGSFGEGWPNLEIFQFENYGNFEPLTRQHFRGMNNVTTLILIFNSDHHMADDILSDLTNLKKMHMSVKHANKNIFKNLTKLERLYIEINSSKSLDNFDTSEMKHLTALKTMELSFNSFTRLTKRFFEGCMYVETLYLHHNTIDEIDADAFEPLTNLRHIHMTMNQMTSLPAGLFSKNERLETCHISSLRDSITSLPPGFFSNLPNLREITVHCKLTSIPTDLIRGSNNLELLNLQFNQLTSMPRDLLENHSKLQKIELYGNEFGSTPTENMFDNKSPITEIRFDKESEQ